MSCTKEEFVNEAKKYIGFNQYNKTHEQIVDAYNKFIPLPRDYRLQYYEYWGSAFISFISNKCKALDMIPIECSIGQQIIAFSNLSTYYSNYDLKPQIGHIVFFTYYNINSGDCSLYPDHVGIVSQLNKHTFTVITVHDGFVMELDLAYCATYISGFACPEYALNNSLNKSENFYPNDDELIHLVLSGAYGAINSSLMISRLKCLDCDTTWVLRKLSELGVS